ncbi:MAG TPA: LuxR C-terminal-related transcriptional regulator [Kofleriaceae bacterium]|nr:LuxR C-terminal-related transcriptional regulator [Kofleriaceae bacterium]
MRPDDPAPLESAIPRLRQLADVESIICASPVQSTSGWTLDSFHADNLPNASRFRALFATYLSRVQRDIGWFNAVRPEPEQRNVLVDLAQMVPADELAASALYTQVLQPLHLHRHHIVRSLLCDGESLLAWVGAFNPTPFDAAQLELLEAAVPALQRRLVIDRQIESAPIVNAALAAVLEQIAGPAFIVSSNGRIHDVNGAGRAMLESRRKELSLTLIAALAGDTPPLPIEMIPLADHGVHGHWLAVIRSRTADHRATSAIARTAARLKLTRRQREVLARVVVGESNATIAAALEISERAVEQHITALFDRAAVDSRAALVTYVLLS